VYWGTERVVWVQYTHHVRIVCGGGGHVVVVVLVVVSGSCCAGDGHVFRCYCCMAAAIILAVEVVPRRRLVCGWGGPVQMYKTINLFWSAILFAGDIAMKDEFMKGEFIVVSYRRLMLHDFSNNLLITKVECLSVAAVVAAAWPW
jgi:hypothetical protein